MPPAVLQIGHLTESDRIETETTTVSAETEYCRSLMHTSDADVLADGLEVTHDP